MFIEQSADKRANYPCRALNVQWCACSISPINSKPKW